nr:hypothetical protein BaRGS_010301 [Batillaria attramentaria]
MTGMEATSEVMAGPRVKLDNMEMISGQGERRGVALRDPDVFLEALLEDECALYAGRLQSFFRQMEMSCDRKDLPDPVARILTEGDDMHFVPICEEPGYRPALEGSAFACYTPA